MCSGVCLFAESKGSIRLRSLFNYNVDVSRFQQAGDGQYCLQSGYRAGSRPAIVGGGERLHRGFEIMEACLWPGSPAFKSIRRVPFISKVLPAAWMNGIGLQNEWRDQLWELMEARPSEWVTSVNEQMSELCALGYQEWRSRRVDTRPSTKASREWPQ